LKRVESFERTLRDVKRKPGCTQAVKKGVSAHDAAATAKRFGARTTQVLRRPRDEEGKVERKA
jgi:hypothetical protein